MKTIKMVGFSQSILTYLEQSKKLKKERQIALVKEIIQTVSNERDRLQQNQVGIELIKSML